MSRIWRYASLSRDTSHICGYEPLFRDMDDLQPRRRFSALPGTFLRRRRYKQRTEDDTDPYKEPSMTSHLWRSRALAAALLTFAFLAAPAARAADAKSPDTPAGKVFAAWLAAF